LNRSTCATAKQITSASVTTAGRPEPCRRRGLCQQLPDQPTWKLLAETLVMAAGYE
jgi:hypothetical protein